MKKTTTRLTIAAAFLALAAGVASAESLRADVPFAFRIGNKLMAPGSYLVQITGATNNVVTLRNATTKEIGLALPIALAEPSMEWKANGDAVLSFECGVDRCALTRIWSGGSAPADSLAHPKLAAGEQASVTLVRMSRANGD